jgi:hypothetical protein
VSRNVKRVGQPEEEVALGLVLVEDVSVVDDDGV